MYAYKINKETLKKRLLELGYRSLSAFAAKTGMHRNSLLNLLIGRDVFCSTFRKIAEELRIDPLDLIVPAAFSKLNIDFLGEIYPIVNAIIEYDKEIAVALIGSRAKRKAKKYSDWDIGIVRANKPISGREYLKLKAIVDEKSENLVRIIDLVNLNAAPLWFLENIKDDIIFLEGSNESFVYLKGVLDGIKKRKAA